MLKTLTEWQQPDTPNDLLDYIKSGDEVDEALYWEMLGAVPPEYVCNDVFQVGEPTDHKDGHPRYSTFTAYKGRYWYVGAMFSLGKAHKRALSCCCCGSRPAPALRQWWNRDNGYGMCGNCIEYNV